MLIRIRSGLDVSLPGPPAQAIESGSRVSQLRASYYGEPGGRVEHFMSRTPRAVESSANLVALARLFAKTPHRRFPVVEHGRLVGVVSRRDVVRAMQSVATPATRRSPYVGCPEEQLRAPGPRR